MNKGVANNQAKINLLQSDLNTALSEITSLHNRWEERAMADSSWEMSAEDYKIRAESSEAELAELRESRTMFTEDDWSRMTGSIIDTVHLTNEDDVHDKLKSQLKRYFASERILDAEMVQV